MIAVNIILMTAVAIGIVSLLAWAILSGHRRTPRTHSARGQQVKASAPVA